MVNEQIKELAKHLIFCKGTPIGVCRTKIDCRHCLAEQVYNAGYRKQSEWISVEDRLPTECENVLCFENGKVYVAFLEHAEYSAVWWDWVDYDRDDTWVERTPTHWMPLPEAPKMKGE